MGHSEKKIYLVTVGVRLAVLILILATLGTHGLISFGDAPNYHDMARDMVRYHSFATLDYPLLEGTRPPGYPFYLAIFLFLHLPLWLASLLQIILVSFIPIITMRLCNLFQATPDSVYGIEDPRFDKSNRDKWVGWVSALEPLGVFYSVVLLSDTFGALFFIAGIYLLVRFWQSRDIKLLALSALFLALMNYIRPSGLFFYLLIPCVLIIAGFLWDRPQVKKIIVYGLIFAGVFTLILLPWRMRNMREFGVFGFVSGIERQLYDITAVAVRARAENVPYPQMQLKMREEIKPLLPEPRDMASFYNHGILTAPALHIILAHKFDYAIIYGRSLLTFLTSGNYQYILQVYNFINSESAYLIWSLLGRVFWSLIFALSLFGAYQSWKNHKASFAVLIYVSLLLYSMLLVANLTVGVEARHRLFLHPFYFIFVAIAIERIITWQKNYQTKKLS